MNIEIKKAKVGILNYKCGNINSIISVFDHLNSETIILKNSLSKNIENITHLVLPGVGSFGYCSKNFQKSKLDKIFKRFYKKKLPILSICVGMQLLGNRSEESPDENGLNIFDFKVKKFDKNNNKYKVPHVGWNSVKFKKTIGKLKSNINYDFYFDHSFYVSKNKFEIGSTNHGNKFCSVIEKDNVLSCQFHPEKSQENGIKFLEYFLSK